MIIKKIEVQGFKSFAERTKIVLHSGITAIVGPNGTGKSNIVDAILWAMGGHRLKSVRGDTTQDIIFNGNAKRPPLGMADVELTFQNEDESLLLSHRVFRSGESEYRLDGKSVRLKDVQDELWKRSIGEKGYYVIEQGTIGTFVTSKPMEKRGLIEEAAGTAFYKDKKRQAQQKLENTEQNLTRLEDIIAEVEKAKNSLQRQAAAATRYRHLRERVRELTTAHFQRRLRRIELTQKDTVDRYNACLERERDMVSRLKIEEKELAQKRKELWDLEKSLKDGQEKLFALKSQIARLDSEMDRETKRAEFFEEKRKKADSDREELERELRAIDKEIAEAQKNLEERTQAFELIRRDVESSAAQIEATREQRLAQEKQLAKIQDDHLRLVGGLTEKRNERMKLEKEVELFLRQEDKLAGQVVEQQAAIAENRSRIEHLQKEIAARESAAKEKEKKLAETRTEAAAAGDALKGIQDSLAALQQRRDRENHHLQVLKSIEEKERSSAAHRDFPGSLGTLADLIETDPGDAPLFDVFWKDEAGSTVVAAEEFLDHLPGEETRGDFLLLPPSFRESFPREIAGDPEFLGLLKARVKPADKARNVLPHLREAAVVRDVRSAVRLWLAFPEVNFITASGDLLLSSGLLRLGRKEEGLIALAQEIRAIEERLAGIENDISPLSVRLQSCSAEKLGLEKEIEAEASALFHLERELQDLRKEIKFAQTEKEKIETTADILSRELGVLRSDKDKMSGEMESLAQAVAAIEAEAANLKERLAAEEARQAESQEQRDSMQRRFFELRSNRDLVQERMSSLRREIQSLARRKETAEGKIDSLKAEARTSDEEKTALQSYIGGLSERAKTLNQDRQVGEKALAGDEELLQKAKKAEDELDRRIQKLREEEESAKEERVKWEVIKAEVERDHVNLEETCWQELKKTPAELKAETEALEKGLVETGAAGEAEKPQAEEFEDIEPEAEANGEAPSQEETAREESQEKPRPRRTIKFRPITELGDQDIEEELEAAKDGLQKYKAVNLMAEEEYVEQKKRFDFLVQQRSDLRESINSTQEAIRKIDEESKSQFIKALEEVNKNFRELFALLFKGGLAEVKLLEPENPLESGVEIVAQPPGKRVQNLALLSGGEKSLTSIAFLFALFRYRPSPFCFLDEVDAALDDVNLTRFLNLMRTIKSQTQFIIVTHNYKSMEVADYIYGTTMEEPNITKIYSMKIEKKEEPKPAS